MPAFTPPTGWAKYDSAKDQVTFSRVGHTAALPNLCIIKRSTVSATGASPATSKYSLKYVLGVDQGSIETASIASPNALVDITIRHVDAPTTQLGAENNELNEILDEIAALIVSVDFKENAKTSLLIPAV